MGKPPFTLQPSRQTAAAHSHAALKHSPGDAPSRSLQDELAEKVAELETTRSALRLSEDRLRSLIANIPGAVYQRALDDDLTVEFISDRIAEITGFDAGALAGGRERSYASLIHPDDRSSVIASVTAAAAAGQTYGLAYRVIRSDGAVIWVGDKGQPIPAGEGGAVWLCGTVTDITERKRLEAERDRMELDLQVAHKLEAVGQLAAGIAHEINTPIQFIGDSVQFLRDAFEDYGGLLTVYRQAATADPDSCLAERLRKAEEDADLAYLEERVPAAIERTLDGVERVASLVRAMKEFAHPQSDQAPADINRALATTLTVARNEYKYVADVETSYGELPDVVCSIGDLNQVFLNLIVNGAHAIQEAALAPGEKGTLRIETRVEGGSVLVVIGDTGCGIPNEIQARVFDPFFTTKPVGRGSGQGLAIAHAVVEKHRGTLDFESTPGVGTTFTIRLPIDGIEATRRELSP